MIVKECYYLCLKSSYCRLRLFAWSPYGCTKQLWTPFFDRVKFFLSQFQRIHFLYFCCHFHCSLMKEKSSVMQPLFRFLIQFRINLSGIPGNVDTLVSVPSDVNTMISLATSGPPRVALQPSRFWNSPVLWASHSSIISVTVDRITWRAISLPLIWTQC